MPDWPASAAERRRSAYPGSDRRRAGRGPPQTGRRERRPLWRARPGPHIRRGHDRFRWVREQARGRDGRGPAPSRAPAPRSTPRRIRTRSNGSPRSGACGRRPGSHPADTAPSRADRRAAATVAASARTGTRGRSRKRRKDRDAGPRSCRTDRPGRAAPRKPRADGCALPPESVRQSRRYYRRPGHRLFARDGLPAIRKTPARSAATGHDRAGSAPRSRSADRAQ